MKTRYEYEDMVLAQSKNFWAVWQGKHHDRIDIYPKAEAQWEESKLMIEQVETPNRTRIVMYAKNYTIAAEMISLSKKAYKLFQKR